MYQSSNPGLGFRVYHDIHKLLAGIRQEELSERLIEESGVRSTPSLALIHRIDLASLDPRREGTNEAILETLTSQVVARADVEQGNNYGERSPPRQSDLC